MTEVYESMNALNKSVGKCLGVSKPVELVKFLEGEGWYTAYKQPKEWDNLLLLKNSFFGMEYDLILAWSESSGILRIYKGKWNDGVV